MTIKDLFRLILKLFGLYFLVAVVFTVMPNLILTLKDGDPGMLLWIVFTIILLCAIFLFLVFKADNVINFFRLDHGFDSTTIDVEKIDAVTLLKFGCIVIGGLLVVDNVAPVLSNGYQLFRGSIQGELERTLFGAQDIKQDFALNSINLLIGFILITNYDRVSHWLNQSNTKIEKTG